MPRFPKKERLCSKKAIDRLFCNGKSISEKPIRFVWNLEKKQNDSCSTKVLISVSKKSLKSSVDRNKIKRKIKEIYRLKKSNLDLFLKKTGKQIALAVIYEKKEMSDYKFLEQKINVLLNRLIKQL